MSLPDAIDSLLGLGLQPKDLGFVQVAVRGLVVFLVALIMVRLGDRRFLSKKTAFDAILGFILASMLARAVNGSAAFWPTLGGGFVLVSLHRLLAHCSRRWHACGVFVKGRGDLIIQQGEVIEGNLQRNDLSEDDLMEDLRLNGHVEKPADVKLAYFERNGEISVLRRSR